MATRQEIIAEQVPAYTAGDNTTKSRILDALMATTNYDRKSLIRRLGQLTRTPTPIRPTRTGRPRTYGNEATAALKCLWDFSHECSGERLHPQLSEYVFVFRRCGRWRFSREATDQLLSMSEKTIKRRIAAFRHEQVLLPLRGMSTTKPSELKELIPIRHGPWENPEPGYGEIDTVVHCGSSLAGDLAFTVQYTDVATLWVLLAAQWNKGQMATKMSIQGMRERLPFPLLSLDPDSGSEFINWLLYGWCKSEGITMTRIRPGKKNDHGRIEQKNYTNVRQFVGYVRLDQQKQAILLQELYDVLEDYLNFFIPSRKCLRRERLGSRYHKVYDVAATPYARALAHPGVSEMVKIALRAKYQTLDPLALKHEVDQRTERLLASAIRPTSVLR